MQQFKRDSHVLALLRQDTTQHTLLARLCTF
jgi:hypothetical protein